MTTGERCARRRPGRLLQGTPGGGETVWVALDCPRLWRGGPRRTADPVRGASGDEPYVALHHAPPQSCQRAIRRRSGLLRTGGGQLNILQTAATGARTQRVERNGQAARLISTSQLRVSPPLHTWPITWSSSRSLQRPCGLGDLILWRVSRLDAFSVSPVRT